MRRRCNRVPLVVLAWNPHLGNRRVTKALTKLNRRRRAHVIILNEVPYRHRDLKVWAKVYGYRMFAEEPGDRAGRVVAEAGSTVVLVDTTRVKVLRARVVPGRKAWRVMSHDRWHEPRRDWLLRLRLDGQVYRLFASHVATNGPDGPNGPAVREWMRRVERAVRNRRPDVVVLDGGDHNNPVAVLRRLVDGLARVKGRGPDSLIAAGVRRLRKKVWRRRFGSDHHPIRYVVHP